jgi:LysR family transcriptional regulator of gallate degradation
VRCRNHAARALQTRDLFITAGDKFWLIGDEMQSVPLPEDHSLPNLRHVRLIMLISEGLSLRKAAQRLRLTQPAVTLGLATLENQYGAPFFERRAAGLAQTPAGAAFARRAARCMFYLSRALSRFCSEAERSPVERLEKLMGLLTIPQLRALVAMDEHEGFRPAAESLGLSVPSVHRAIGHLEARVGEKLVHREKYGASLNFLGHETAVLFSLALRELRSASTDINTLNGHLEGAVTVGCVRVTASVLLPEAIHECVKAFPGARFLVVHQQYEDMLEQLRSGRMDYICSTARKDIPADFRAEKLCLSELCIICGPDHPLVGKKNINARMLAEFPWIASEPGTGARVRMNAMFEQEGVVLPHVAVITHQFSLIRSLLLQTNFLSLTTRSGGGEDHELSGLCIVNKKVPDPCRDIWLLSRHDWEPTRLQEEFVKMLRRAAQ